MRRAVSSGERGGALGQSSTGPDGRRRACLVDTTMLYAPESGGVRRYLTAKRAWMARNRPQVRHSLVLPGRRDADDGQGLRSIYTAPLPFGRGYRWPMSKTAWTARLVRQDPTLIEAEDPYTPGLAALEAGEALRVPVIGFCHTDLPALAATRLGKWSQEMVRKRWAGAYGRFDAVVAPSRYLAARLQEAGVRRVEAVPLGVDLETFSPARADRARVRAALGLQPHERLLVFAGRPAAEKRVPVMVEAVARLGSGWRLLLIGAGAGLPAAEGVIRLPFQRDSAALARLLASCDALVHANPAEALGLVVLEAMACGLPVVGVAGGGVAETIVPEVGQLAAGSGAADLAEAIAALFERDVAAVGQQARAHVAERYSWDRAFDQLSAVYAGLTGDSAFAAKDVHGAPAP
ncbi:glycosyltransferase [Caulobacter sp. 17J80-11]|uniref:glycosyltransferase n=1 Tax=Caulobacter sp. 17J80-11 TaxID=2763502 RepID=UPI001653A4F0|nr:glycosyltransferase [Caulobacter sp. 17J80-11]MBC6982521.1 glycosyltransferase [Caulobacter sp. 17J80-11]